MSCASPCENICHSARLCGCFSRQPPVAGWVVCFRRNLPRPSLFDASLAYLFGREYCYLLCIALDRAKYNFALLYGKLTLQLLPVISFFVALARDLSVVRKDR